MGRISSNIVIVGFALAACLLPRPALASHFHRGPTSTHAHKSKGTAHASQFGRHRESTASSAGRPRAIDDARANQIQTALVKAGYLQTASGKWDSESADAMRKLQSDNGWQTKIIPDSRALIKLGLGPGSEAPAASAVPGQSSLVTPMALSGEHTASVQQ